MIRYWELVMQLIREDKVKIIDKVHSKLFLGALHG